MDQHHRTSLKRVLGSLPSRRAVLRGLANVGFGLAAVRLSHAAEAKHKHHQKGKKHKHTSPQPTSPPPPLPAPPNLETSVDATCAGADLAGGGSRDGNVRIAQTFTTLSTGLLVTAELPIVKRAGSEGDYVRSSRARGREEVSHMY